MNAPPPLLIEGPRLALREWGADEVDGLHRWFADPDVTRFLDWGGRSKTDSAAHLAEIVAEQSREARTRVFLALVLKEAPVRTIGDAGFTLIAPETAEIGYFLEPSYWGRGLGSEAAGLVIELARERGVRRIVAGCAAENFASARVLEKNGLRPLPDPEPGRRRFALDL